MDYATALAHKRALEAAEVEAGSKLAGYPKLANGLTPDHIKATPEWKAAFYGYGRAANALRAFNRAFLREHGKQYRADMLAARKRVQA